MVNDVGGDARGGRRQESEDLRHAVLARAWASTRWARRAWAATRRLPCSTRTTRSGTRRMSSSPTAPAWRRPPASEPLAHLHGDDRPRRELRRERTQSPQSVSPKYVHAIRYRAGPSPQSPRGNSPRNRSAGRSAFVGGTGLLAAYSKRRTFPVEGTLGEFTAEKIAFLDEIAETILPATKTPGAKAAKTGAFMALMVTDCYLPAEQTVFREGMRKVDDAMRKPITSRSCRRRAATVGGAHCAGPRTETYHGCARSRPIGRNKSRRHTTFA